MNIQTNTKTTNKHIVFLRDAAGWYADMEGSRESNAMVAGADTMLSALAGDKNRIEFVFSSDVEAPASYLAKCTRIEHDFAGGTYYVHPGSDGTRLSFRGIMGLPMMWICNQTHLFLSEGDVPGEHPKTIYIQEIKVR